MSGRVLEHYERRLSLGEIELDEAQRRAAARLDRLAAELSGWRPSRLGLFARLDPQRRLGAARRVHAWRRRPRQDHADGSLLRGDGLRAEAPAPLSRVHERGARAHRARAGDDRRRPHPLRRRRDRSRRRPAVLRRASRHRHCRRHDPRPAVQGALRARPRACRDLERRRRTGFTGTASTGSSSCPSST